MSATVSLSQFCVPVFIRSLENLSAILKKGVEFADEKKMDHSELLQAKLVDDMANLIFQIQRCSDTAKNTCVRVGGDAVQSVAMEDKEQTFDELQARIQKTIDFLKNVPASAIDGRENATVLLKLGGQEMKFTGYSYLAMYAIPNFFFHVTTAYALLRHKGVPVGKADFLGPPPQ